MEKQQTESVALQKIPIFAIGTEHCIVATTASMALLTVGNGQTAALQTAGLACSRTVAWVITPRVPSEPMKSFVRL